MVYQGQIIKAKRNIEQQKQKENISNASEVVVSKNSKEVELTLEDAKKQAEQILQKAYVEGKKRSDEIIAEAKAKAEMIALSKAAQLNKDFTEELAGVEGKLGKIIADCVRKIIGGLPEKDIERSVLKTALREYGQHHVLSIKVTSKSFDEAWWENWRWAKDNNLDKSLFEKDNSMEDGRCIVNFAGHEIDIGVKTQLDALEIEACKKSSNIATKRHEKNPKIIENPKD